MVRLNVLYGLVLLASVSDAQLSPRFRETKETFNRTELARLNGAPTDVTAVDLDGNYKFLCSIYNSDTAAASLTGIDEKYGPGVIIHKYWVIAHIDLHKAVVDADLPTKLKVATNTVDGYTPSDSTLVRRVKQRVKQDVYAPVGGVGPSTSASTDMYLNKIQLFRVCPSFDDVRKFDINTAPATIVAGDPYIYFNFHPVLKSHTKLVGEECECDAYYVTTNDYTTHVAPYTFCGQENADKTIESNDKVGTVAVITKTGKLYAGFFLANNKGGDLYLDISAYKTWISSVAV